MNKDMIENKGNPINESFKYTGESENTYNIPTLEIGNNNFDDNYNDDDDENMMMENNSPLTASPKSLHD